MFPICFSNVILMFNGIVGKNKTKHTQKQTNLTNFLWQISQKWKDIFKLFEDIKQPQYLEGSW